MSEQPIFFASGTDPNMLAAFTKAQSTFKYFWRECSWEYRRIVPALDLACVKIAFSQSLPGRDEPVVEYIWMNEIDFNGDEISGVIVNQPNELTNIQNGDYVTVPLDRLCDWLFTTEGKSYGGYTIQYMRSLMEAADRSEHDDAWGIDFGDHHEIFVARGQKDDPNVLIEHPMSINMREKFVEFIQQYPNELTSTDDFGANLLHRETIAGNKTSVEAMVTAGADLQATTRSGKTALDYAKQLNWEHIIPLLEK
ncbi:uncharacterized protein YegJ (DUF2314 family) [Chitinophaga skermanii]|uniref:Uncharacterized protein YegJ (DUF2314 family) n=1 Tax=Chitinophaga skermanii TaxID=331697 RepID=A0A327QZ25_9BACT|nr:DUF2314 domain-containing protein [Chitinophaga skermanii]RAJ08683.1 uncharacterized protein YegJ (DUF2314 family) [Chitinophaga skermanii]